MAGSVRGILLCDNVFVFLRVQIRNAIDALANRNFGRAVQRLNDDPSPHGRKFWKLVRNLRRRPAAMPTIHSADGPLVTAAEKCDALVSHYRDIAGDLPLRHGPVLRSMTRQHVDDLRSASLDAGDVLVISRRAVEDCIKESLLYI